MEYCINGDTAMFLETGLHTFGIAGCLALGVLTVSSTVRLYTAARRRLEHLDGVRGSGSLFSPLSKIEDLGTRLLGCVPFFLP